MFEKYKNRIIAVGVAVLVVVAFAGGILIHRELTREPAVPVITSDTVLQEVHSIAELSTLDYRYTNVGKFENKVDFYGWAVPFTTKSFIITYDGSMKLGVDLAEATVTVEDGVIQVTIPAAQVQSHEIFESTLEVLDQTKNIFNPIQIEDYTSFAVDQKQVMEQKVRDSGMFGQAETNAREYLERLLTFEGYETVIVVET